ncbi:E3 ubiquitin-protein ligase SIAH1 [Orchesella cincta]|uniref:E3 ubiquitin-protein ligase SIAH1 n=1 Tax=Orchesella cincta TaxID=48709 RepID=A0A1D2MIC0_ORCCI|nr:E3 ubiquitin-protein ligase SIAH1 [Orchesella cincta]
MEEHLKCPICFEIPAQEIYQCASGHTVCGTCSANLELCPQCREPYGTKKIRNRALEQILDTQTFDCIHKDEGCKEKLKRQEILKHADICPLNKKAVSFCQKIGFKNCNFSLDPSNLPMAVKHFEENHGAASEKGNQVVIWHTDFNSAMKSTTNRKWNPVLLNTGKAGSNKSLFMILGRVDIRRDFASWRCIQICGSGDKCSDIFEAEFGFGNASEIQIPCRWTIPVVKSVEDNLSAFITFCPIEIPLWLISGICLSVEDVPISVLIQNAKKSKERTLKKLPEVWTFSSQIETLQALTSFSGGEASHNYICSECHVCPLLGKRFKCLQCVDFDLCETCMEQMGTHSHIFAVIRTANQSELMCESFIRIR